jgi:hypothetical protein
MENLFDTLCSALLEPEIKKLFHEGEGVDLMLIMMKCVCIFLLEMRYIHPRVLTMQRKTLSQKSRYQSARPCAYRAIRDSKLRDICYRSWWSQDAVRSFHGQGI